jgi:hypothetical protein
MVEIGRPPITRTKRLLSTTPDLIAKDHGRFTEATFAGIHPDMNRERF